MEESKKIKIIIPNKKSKAKSAKLLIAIVLIFVGLFANLIASSMTDESQFKTPILIASFLTYVSSFFYCIFAAIKK